PLCAGEFMLLAESIESLLPPHLLHAWITGVGRCRTLATGYRTLLRLGKRSWFSGWHSNVWAIHVPSSAEWGRVAPSPAIDLRTERKFRVIDLLGPASTCLRRLLRLGVSILVLAIRLRFESGLLLFGLCVRLLLALLEVSLRNQFRHVLNAEVQSVHDRSFAN